jgi:glutathione synthase
MKRFLIIADAVSAWDPIIETTAYIIAEANRRSFETSICDSTDIFFAEGQLWARVARIQVKTKRQPEDPFEWRVGHPEPPIPLTYFDAAFARKNPPIDLSYMHHLQMLALLEERLPVFSKPSALLRWNEKLSALYFNGEVAAQTVVHWAKTPAAKSPAAQFVRKRLDSFGGHAVDRIADVQTATQPDAFVLDQPFNPAVADGDKRVLILAGRTLAYFNRIPAPGDWRANLRFGASVARCALTPREEDIVQRWCTLSEKEQLFLVGLDLIGGNLSEVNLTSVGGFHIVRLLGLGDPAVEFWDELLKRL